MIFVDVTASLLVAIVGVFFAVANLNHNDRSLSGVWARVLMLTMSASCLYAAWSLASSVG